ncbi:pyruvate, water dikinase [Pseudonocardia thermophila]|uniref:Pyruvate, water dikinase n=1 Tax=Pseudonocardia thermophila TaxID=1848 RepID=A0A1M6ZDQ4_PSETH|nr:PEP/pyruvate-binding domain-containing protein [Pseudonocardia thermophila]SHL28598.1 pyruvate, water dikinase [Pseudonocardia thermophila]
MTVIGTVIGLDSPDARRLELVGGKGANLAELIAAGFAVPRGFCVSTAAYHAAAEAARIAELLAAGGPDLPARAREALRTTPSAPETTAAITAAYAALGDDVPVAVRSSATAEDLPGASFAGQQDTYLNVVGAEAVLDAVRRCWASLWTDRAYAYRETTGIDQHTVALAVVVQEMVDAQVAGVLFTADPVSGRRTRTVIDAAPGLGEAVVSGAVNPDHIVVEDGRIDYTPGEQAVAVRALPGGGTEHEELPADTTHALTDDQVRALAELGRAVERHCGSPQDVEWAIDIRGALLLTQARPITTLHPVPTPNRPGLRAFFNVSLAQGLTRPITPAGIAAVRMVAATASTRAFGIPADPELGPPTLTAAGGRIFIDATEGLRNQIGRRLLPRILDVMEARSAVVMRALLEDPAYAPRPGSGLRFLKRIARTMLRFHVPPQVLLALASPPAARRRIDRIGARVYAHRPLAEAATAIARIDHAAEVLRAAFPVLPTVVPAAGAGFAMLGLARLLAGQAIDANTVHELLRSLPHNTTTEMDLQLWDLAVELRADPESARVFAELPPAELAARWAEGRLPRNAQEGVTAFLRRHGHRAVAEIDLGMPRWSDDPTYVLGVLANYLRMTDPEQAPDAVFARGAAAAEAAVAQVAAEVGERSPAKARLVRWALGRMRELTGLRETHKDYLVRMIAVARAELAAVGRELAGRGMLGRADDVFWLDFAEARRAVGGEDLQALVAERRAEYDRELQRRHVPRILLSDGTEPEALKPAGAAADGALVGTAASAGTVTGAARVVLDPVGAHLEPGEILVVPSTDPGWTPLFLTAGGLVMEMGGANSHGAVVAREYGIPAVVGVPDATVAITTGDRITVDGAAGVVTRAPADAPAPAAV